MSRHRACKLIATVIPLIALAAACSDSTITVYKPGTSDTLPGPVIPRSMRVRASQPFPEDRCAKNREFGPITVLTNLNYTASAGVIDVLAAQVNGYFAELCLEVVVTPSFSTENYPLVAGNEAQFAVAGSFSEMVDFAGRNNAQFVAVMVDGRLPLDTLILKPTGPTKLAELRGATLGVQGGVPPAVAAMLAKAGLQHVADEVVTRDFELLDQQDDDPMVRLADPAVAGITGRISEDLVSLQRAKVAYTTLDPKDAGIPGSFGVIYTNATFAREYPTVVEDFIRAASRGRADAVAEPEQTVMAVAATLPAEARATFDVAVETARWQAEIARLRASPLRAAPGIPLISLLTAEIRSGASIGLFDDAVPSIEQVVDDGPMRAVYSADGELIWPAREAP